MNMTAIGWRMRFRGQSTNEIQILLPGDVLCGYVLEHYSVASYSTFVIN